MCYNMNGIMNIIVWQIFHGNKKENEKWRTLFRYKGMENFFQGKFQNETLNSY